MPKRQVKSGEAVQLLNKTDLNVLLALAKISRDEKTFNALVKFLDSLVWMDKDKIVKSAGGVNSMDVMIDKSIDQSFYRGRISMAVLIHTVVKNAGVYSEKRMESKK